MRAFKVLGPLCGSELSSSSLSTNGLNELFKPFKVHTSSKSKAPRGLCLLQSQFSSTIKSSVEFASIMSSIEKKKIELVVCNIKSHDLACMILEKTTTITLLIL